MILAASNVTKLRSAFIREAIDHVKNTFYYLNPSTKQLIQSFKDYKLALNSECLTPEEFCRLQQVASAQGVST
ncbi:MAG: hypothetical protein ACRDBG_07705, partial [Waterburya sp.]